MVRSPAQRRTQNLAVARYLTMSRISAWIAVVAALLVVNSGIGTAQDDVTVHLVFSNHLVRRMPLRDSQAGAVWEAPDRCYVYISKVCLCAEDMECFPLSFDWCR